MFYCLLFFELKNYVVEDKAEVEGNTFLPISNDSLSVAFLNIMSLNS